MAPASASSLGHLRPGLISHWRLFPYIFITFIPPACQTSCCDPEGSRAAIRSCDTAYRSSAYRTPVVEGEIHRSIFSVERIDRLFPFHVSSAVGHNCPLASGQPHVFTRLAECWDTTAGLLTALINRKLPWAHPWSSVSSWRNTWGSIHLCWIRDLCSDVGPPEQI